MLGAEVISVGAAIVFAETVVDAELGLDEDGAAAESCVLPRLAETLRTGVRGMIMESIDVRRVEIVDAGIMGYEMYIQGQQFYGCLLYTSDAADE